MEHAYGARIDCLMLMPLQRADLEHLRLWRNSKSVSFFLRKIPTITKDQQITWFEDYLAQDDCLYWSIVSKDEVIGSLAVYNIIGNSAEIGKIMIGEQRHRGKGYGYQSMLMAMKLGFEFLGIQTYKLSVHEKNWPALKTYEKIGFTATGYHEFDELGRELEMEIDKNVFEKENPISKHIAVYLLPGGISYESRK